MSALHPGLVHALGALSADEFVTRLAGVADPDVRRDTLKHRFRTDRAGFLRYFLPELFYDPFNGYHLDVLAREAIPWTIRLEARQTMLEADAAPRSFAKTTLAKGELIWALTYDIESLAVVVSNEMSLAEGITDDIRAVFSDPESEFARTYGPFVVKGGVKRFTVTFPDGRWVGVIAKSMTSQIRGLNIRGRRPTIVLLDDAERSDRVRNPKQRRRWWEVIHEDVLKLGSRRGGLRVRLRGTILHPDSGLENILKNPGWVGRRFQACVSWPERQDLWEECGGIFKDLFLGDYETRLQCARAFYEANRADMDRGAVMLDPGALPIFDFYLRIWKEGLKSVLQELQNQPRSSGTKFFQVDETAPGARDGFRRCKVVGTRQTGGHIVTSDGRIVPLSEVRTFARLDPIPGDELGTMGDDGGSGAGDFACIVILGRDQWGFGYVLDVWMRRARDSEQLAALWTLGEKWQLEKATIESNGFQRLLGRAFRSQQRTRRESGLYWQITAEDDNSSKNKPDRIASLEGPTSAGWIEFAEHIGPEALGQFDSFPDGDHDDFPDAVEGAWRLSNTVQVGMVNTPLGAPERRRLSPPPGSP